MDACPRTIRRYAEKTGHLSVIKHFFTVLLLFLCSCINPEDQWGTPEYFGRITGVQFKPASVASCRVEAVPDISAVFAVQLPNDFKTHLDRLGAYPKPLPYEAGRHLQTWRKGGLRPDDQEVFDFAIGAVSFAETGECRGELPASGLTPAIRAAMASPATYFAYQSKGGSATFYILDPVSGAYYEIIHDI